MFDADEDEEDPKHDDTYILEPFPDEKFVPDAWMDILALVDVCANKVTPTAFCDGRRVWISTTLHGTGYTKDPHSWD